MAPQTDASGKPKAANAEKGASRHTQLKYLGKFEILKQIGAGGMGAVYLARDGDLKRTVALKVLPKEKADNETLVKRFRAEAQAAAHLRHDNIVVVYEAGESDGYLYIAMEYIQGTDVHHLVGQRGPIPVKRSLRIIKQMARALQHAYEQGIVHRDIKPSNLLIRKDGVVKLADMGLARSIDDESETGITRAGTTVGTVDYMSPEQARDSKSADIRSDIYSLGCTWYQMLTGSSPFPEGSMTNKLAAHATKPPPDPRESNEAVPEAIVAVLHRMIAKKPEDRYQTPEELLQDLENANLNREAVSQNVLAALTDQDETEDPQHKRKSASRDQPPPRAKRSSASPSKKGKSGLYREWIKYGVIVIVGLALVVIVFSIASQLTSGPGTLEQPSNRNPFAESEGDNTGPQEKTGDSSSQQASKQREPEESERKSTDSQDSSQKTSTQKENSQDRETSSQSLSRQQKQKGEKRAQPDF